MDTIIFVMTRRCNMNCKCCVDKIRQSKRKSNRDITEEVLGFCKNMGVHHVILTGGEPLMEDNVFEVVDIFAKEKIETSIITNGSFPEKVELLKKAGLDNLFVSMDGITEKTHNVIKETNLQSVLKTIAETKRFEINCIINCIVHKFNYMHIGEMIQFAMDTKVRDLFFSPFFEEKDYEKEKMGLSIEQWKSCKKDLAFWAHLYHHENYFQYWKGLYKSTGQSPKKCMALKKGLVIDETGNIFPCFSREDLNCGDVSEDGFESIIDKMQEHAQKICDASCFNEHCMTLEFPF